VQLGDAVSMFVAARRPFLAELTATARRGGVDPRRVAHLYDAATGLLDRLLLAFVTAHESTTSRVGSPEQPRNAPVTR
jgi:hypothetical protein